MADREPEYGLLNPPLQGYLTHHTHGIFGKAIATESVGEGDRDRECWGRRQRVLGKATEIFGKAIESFGKAIATESFGKAIALGSIGKAIESIGEGDRVGEFWGRRSPPAVGSQKPGFPRV